MTIVESLLFLKVSNFFISETFLSKDNNFCYIIIKTFVEKIWNVFGQSLHKILIFNTNLIFFFVICSHWKCIRTKKLSINLRPNRNVLCSHSYSKLCLSKNLRLSPCSHITNYYYVKEKPRKIPADKKMKRKKKTLEKKKNYILLSVSCTIQIKCTYIIMPSLLEHRFLLKNLI